MDVTEQADERADFDQSSTFHGALTEGFEALLIAIDFMVSASTQAMA